AITVMGAGASSCGAWTQSRQSHLDGVPVSWVLGYLSGINVYGGTTADLLKGLDRNAIESWIDNYCQTHPLDHIGVAVDLLLAELLTQAHTKTLCPFTAWPSITS